MKITVTKHHYQKSMEILGAITLSNMTSLSDQLCTEDPLCQALKERGGKVIEVYNDWVEVDGVEYDLDEAGRMAVDYFNRDIDAILFKKKPKNIEHFPMEITLTKAVSKEISKYTSKSTAKLMN